MVFQVSVMLEQASQNVPLFRNLLSQHLLAFTAEARFMNEGSWEGILYRRNH